MILSDESKQTLDLYGVGSEPTDNFGRQCLLARRFVENGVRYIQVSTNYTPDHHQKVQDGHVTESAKVDRPIAGLLADLARCGLLDDTLVLWAAEFGRTPTAENAMAAIIIPKHLRCGWLAAEYAAGFRTVRPTTLDVLPLRIRFTCTTFTQRCFIHWDWITNA